LGLPVIAAAINLRISVTGNRDTNRTFHIDLPDIGKALDVDPEKPIHYENNKDYIRSSFSVLKRSGEIFSAGYNCTIKGFIPINSGTSSSSALVVAWIGFLKTVSNGAQKIDAQDLSKLAFEAEVKEFAESGGMMDQVIAGFGGLLYIDFNNPGEPVRLKGKLGKFVLGDSCETKDTQAILSRVKNGALTAIKKVSAVGNSLTMQTITIDQIEEYKSLLNEDQYDLLKANTINRDLTQDARTLLSAETFDERKFGSLLNAHQKELRDSLKISTPKIDRMIDASLKNGAYGAKINGSGGGGCMFAYAPDSYQKVAEAIKNEGGIPYIVIISDGVRITTS